MDRWGSLKGADGLVAMTSGWRWKDLSEYLNWISTGNCGVGAVRCFDESGERCCPSASRGAQMLVGVSRVSRGAAMPSDAGGGCQGMSGSDKPAYLIGQGVARQ